MSKWRHHVKRWRHIKEKITRSYAGQTFGKIHWRNFQNLLWFRSDAAKSRPGGKFNPPGFMCVNKWINKYISIIMRPEHRPDIFELVKRKKQQQNCRPYCWCHTISGIPRTPLRHLVWNNFGPRGPWPEQFHLFPPDGTDNRRQHQRQTERLPPEPSTILKRFYPLYNLELRDFIKKCLNYDACLILYCILSSIIW